MLKLLKKHLHPEFLNRIDDVVMFNSLSSEHIHEIIDIELKILIERITSLGYSLSLDKKAKDLLLIKVMILNLVLDH